MEESQGTALGLPGAVLSASRQVFTYTLWHMGQLGVPGGRHLWGG